MICRKKTYRVGDAAIVRHCWGGYRLPAGLPDGASVKVLSIEIGYVYVEYECRCFMVSMACVESGWEYRLQGKWRDETDPLIATQLKGATTRRPLQFAFP
jgi:hypothetical protein